MVPGLIVGDNTLYHAAGEAVADVLALAEDEDTLDMAAVPIQMLRLREVVEGNSSHPCSSLVKSLWIKGGYQTHMRCELKCRRIRA